MNNLIDLKRPKEKTSPPIAAESSESYPYGLEISLDAPEIDKLKIDISKIAIGSKVGIIALGKVERISMSERYNNPPRKSLSIQIQQMKLESKSPKALKKSGKVAKPF